MKNVKKVLTRIGYAVLGLCAFVIAGWFVPFSIGGNWLGSGVGCMCASHNFLRFENGKVLRMSEHQPPEWIGTYKIKGWGKYEVELFCLREEDNPFLVRSALLRAKWDKLPKETFYQPRAKLLIRDPFVFTCRKVINDPRNDWIKSMQGFGDSYRITGTAGERLFVRAGGEITREKMVATLNLWLSPLQIYTASNEVPSYIIDTVVQNGFEYHVHSNQHWIETEWVNDDPSLPRWKRDRPLATEEANPIWTNKTFQIIIRMPSGEEKKEDPKIGFFWGEMERLSDFKKRLENFRLNRGIFKNSFYLYAENGILPEDVRQTLEPFDFNYHVRDEKILYRGKQKK